VELDLLPRYGTIPKPESSFGIKKEEQLSINEATTGSSSHLVFGKQNEPEVMRITKMSGVLVAIVY